MDDNKRNSLRLISESNQFIHSYGTNQELYDDGSFSQELKKTYTKKAYFLLKNQLSINQFIVLNTSFSKINNILYFQRENISSLERFVAKYKDVSQINASLNYSAKFNRVLALSLFLN